MHADFGLRNHAGSQSGVSIIAAIFIIVILAFMGVMFVSMITTGSFTSVSDLQALQSFSAADGGVEFEQRRLAQSLNWYRSASDPVSATSRSVGVGSFTVSSTIPASSLRRRLLASGNTTTVYAAAPARFPSAGFLQIEEDVAGSGEFVQYAGYAGNTFTGLTRARTIGTVATIAVDHARGSIVYPVTTLTQPGGLASSCAAPTSFTIAEHPKFLGAGTIEIEGEEISYGGSSVSGGNMTLTGVQRCRGTIGPMAHAAGQPVTPLLVGGDTADVQSEVTSTGSAGSAIRVVKKTVQR